MLIEYANGQHSIKENEWAVRCANFNVIDRQAIFDKAATGIIAQGKASTSKNVGCAYRGDDDCKCGIGQIVTDEAYDPLMENKSPSEARVRRALGRSGVRFVEGSSDALFLGELQRCHDQAVMDTAGRTDLFMPNFKDRMYRLAFDYGLETTALSGPNLPASEAILAA